MADGRAARAARSSRTTRTACSARYRRPAARQLRRDCRRSASTRRRTSPAARAARWSSTTPRFVERAEILREKGTNRSRFFRGQVDKYTWVDVGSSYLPSDLLAAYLLAQLEARDAHPGAPARDLAPLRRRSWPAGRRRRRARCRVVPAHCDHPAHLFYLLLPSLDDAAAAHRAPAGAADPRRVPLPAAAPVGQGPPFGGRAGQRPVTEDVADRLVRLPLLPPPRARAIRTACIDAVTSFTSVAAARRQACDVRVRKASCHGGSTTPCGRQRAVRQRGELGPRRRRAPVAKGTASTARSGSTPSRVASARAIVDPRGVRRC